MDERQATGEEAADPYMSAAPADLFSEESGKPTDLSDRYEVAEPIGQGGMAEVFAAVDRQTGERVALKRLMPHLGARSHVHQRFANEADLLRRCRGRYVVHLYDSGVHEGLPAYVAERCTGSLYDLALERPLPLRRVLSIASEVLVALDRVHAVGCVHRDIKPSNVLMGSDGETRLADFGIARHPHRRLTMMGHRVGTPSFSAPDLLADPRQAAPEHDLFSVGLLILTVSTHLRPMSLIDPRLRKRTLAVLPQSTADLLARATDPDPAARFTTAAEMAIAVQNTLENLF